MKKQGSRPPHKGSRWIADQIAAAFQATRGGLVPEGERLSRAEVEVRVAEALKEALEEVEEKDLKDSRDSKDSKD